MSLFNRPAWAKTQAVDDDDDAEENIFSHSNRSYAAIVAEEQRQKRERVENLRAKQERKERRSLIERDKDAEDSKRGNSSPKRRRITLEEGEDLLGRVGLPSASIKRRSVSASEDTDSFHKRRSPRRHKAVDKDDSRFIKASNPIVVDLDDASDQDDEIQITSARETETVEQESDDEFAELARQARARNKLREESIKKSQTPDTKSPTPGQRVSDGKRSAYPTPPLPDPPVKLLITSQIDGTKPLMVYRKLSQRLQEIRQVWCDKQGFSKEFAEGVFLVHRNRKLFDVTTCKSLGLDVDEDGNIVMKGAEGMEDVDQVHLEAVTDEIYAESKAKKSREERKRHGLEPPEGDAEDGAAETPAEPEEPVIRILLVSKDRREPFKLKVKSTTLVSKMMTACRLPFDAKGGQTVYLDFDGERLDPDQVVGETEITDMDRIDVYIVG